MKLEEVSAVIRPRGAWEAADLGCAMVRRHYPKVMLLWALTAAPIWALVLFLLRNHPGWAIFVIWMLQPLYGRASIFYLSRVLFGEKPSVREVLRQVPRLWSSKIVYSLTVGRVSASRAFLLPVILLERPGVKAFRARSRVLKQQGDNGFALTSSASLVQLCFVLALVALAQMLTTTGANPDWRQISNELFVYLFEVSESGRFDVGALWWLIVLTLVAISFVEPFYLGAGFAQYLDARTHLEGWDVELGFRRISGRLARMRGGGAAAGKMAVVFLMGLFGFCGTEAVAQSAGERSPEEIIEEVMAHEDFEIVEKEETVWVPDVSSNSSGGRSGDWDMNMSWMAGVWELAFWLLLAAGIAYLCLLAYRNRHMFSGDGGDDGAAVPKARTVLGMDVAEESLPADIASAAMEAFRAGDVARAMRLLYRGSISWLVETEGLPVRESDTEGDCLHHAQGMADAGRVSFFGRMTGVWTAFAYGGEVPVEATVEDLCRAWPFRGSTVARAGVAERGQA